MTRREAQEKFDNLESSTRKNYIVHMWLSDPDEHEGLFAEWLAIHPEVFDKLPAEESTGDVNDDEPYAPLEIKSAFDPWGDEAWDAKTWYGSLPNETRKKMYDEWAGCNKDEKNRISWTDFLIMRHKSEPTKSAAMKEFEEKETVNGGEHHYNRGKGTETIDYMEQCAEAWRANGLPEKKIVNLVQALKYLSPRLGRKDDIDIELGKALNYVYRALHGEWLV